MTDADLPLTHAHVPPGDSTDGPAPGVFVLHGRGADEEDLLPVAARLPDALHTISLRAPDAIEGGYTWYEVVAPGGDLHRSQPDPDDFRRSLDLIEGSIRAATDAYGLDPDALGLLGFSQGTVMGLSLLLEAPARYAWCVGLHGYLPESHADRDPAGIAGTPVYLGAGARDQVIPADRAEGAADRLRELGCKVTFDVHDAGHGVGRSELRSVIEFVAGLVG